jgi:hypothetical protein
MIHPNFLCTRRVLSARFYEVSAIWRLLFVLALVTSFISSCAHRPILEKNPHLQNKQPSEVLLDICTIGHDIEHVSGTLQMRAKSPEASGQFPASVMVDSAQRRLDLEVTNPLGGTEARIRVEGQSYRIIAGRGEKSRQEEGHSTWAGIPLHWAVDLFLGRFPCPKRDGLQVSFDDHQQLVARVEASLSGGEEVYRYHLDVSDDGTRIWPRMLEWKQAGALGAEVRFQFFSPEDGTQSPTRWEVESSRGEIKAKWRERDLRILKREKTS